MDTIFEEQYPDLSWDDFFNTGSDYNTYAICPQGPTLIDPLDYYVPHNISAVDIKDTSLPQDPSAKYFNRDRTSPVCSDETYQQQLPEVQDFDCFEEKVSEFEQIMR
ncbi:hypothetical protein MMC34_008377, partial [Xylographa carneopallida]|nr:hypothetical protein [Xylographa carneopallida]